MAMSVDIFEALRRDIVLGQYEPMHLFDPRRLANKHLTSVAPIREAMLRLSERGLLRWERNRGFFVEKLSASSALFYIEQLRTAYLSAVKRHKENDTEFKTPQFFASAMKPNSLKEYIEWQRVVSDTVFCNPEREFVGILWDRIWLYRNKYLKDDELRSKFVCASQEAAELLFLKKHGDCQKQIDKTFQFLKEIIPAISLKINI